MCDGVACAFDDTLSPISETRLTRAEQYALAMAERNKGDTDAA
jgi:hypothetical protein